MFHVYFNPVREHADSAVIIEFFRANLGVLVRLRPGYLCLRDFFQGILSSAICRTQRLTVTTSTIHSSQLTLPYLSNLFFSFFLP